MICNKNNKIDQALEFYELAIQAKSDKFEARYDRAELYLEKKMWGLAKKDLLFLIKNDIKHPMVYIRLAEISIQNEANQEMYDYLVEAVTHGFNVHNLVMLQWGKWANDPRFRSEIKAIVLLYGGHSTWNLLISSPY